MLQLTPKGTRVGIDAYIQKLKESYKNISAEEYDRLTNTLTLANNQPIENGLAMSKAAVFKNAASFGAIGGTAMFLTEPKDKLYETAKGFGYGAGIYLAGRQLFKMMREMPSEFDKKSYSTY